MKLMASVKWLTKTMSSGRNRRKSTYCACLNSKVRWLITEHCVGTFAVQVHAIKLSKLHQYTADKKP